MINKYIYIISVTLTLLFGPIAFAAETKQMRCEDGQSFKIAYPASDLAIMDYSGELILLRSVASASGTRYVGEHWQWWNKGEEGYLTPLAKNERYASAKGISCSIFGDTDPPSHTTVRPATPQNAVITNEAEEVIDYKVFDYEQEREPKPFKYE